MRYLSRICEGLRRWYLRGIVRRMEENLEKNNIGELDNGDVEPRVHREVNKSLEEGIRLIEGEIDKI